MFKDIIRLEEAGVISKRELAKKIANLKLPLPLAVLSKQMVAIVVATIWITPLVSTFYIVEVALTFSSWQRYSLFATSPLVFLITFLFTAIIWARISKAAIIEGKFPRKHDHPIYAMRRIYGSAWTQIYYFKPLYAICLAIPTLKRILFRGFGYKGDLNLTVYPDSWLRDLPMLNLGKNVYLANRCTVGTNICLNDGSVIIGKISTGDNVMVGHLAMIGLGSNLGDKVEVGVNTVIGLRVKIGEKAVASPCSEINHASTIGKKANIGTSASVGLKSRIGDGVVIKPGAVVPPGAQLITQGDADEYFDNETTNLKRQTDNLMRLLKEHKIHGSENQTG